jgi:hypothetical protein
MKTKYAALLGLLLILCFLGLTIQGQKQTPARTTWEYKSLFSSSGDLAYVLNDLGAQGWELVTIDVNSNKNGLKGATYYLKRAK